MPLFLMRHGRTNLSGTFCGSSNPRLNRRGKAQAVAAANALLPFPIEFCHVSPQRRAQETAAIVCRRRKIRRQTNPLLREIAFGLWESRRFSEVQRRWPALAAAWIKNPIRVPIPGAESFASLRRRVKRFLSQTKKVRRTQNVLIVAHGGTLAAMMMELLKRPNREYPNHIQPTGSIRCVQGRRVSWVHRAC